MFASETGIRYKAAVVYGDPEGRKTAALGPEAEGTVEALEKLQGVLAAATRTVGNQRLDGCQFEVTIVGGKVATWV